MVNGILNNWGDKYIDGWQFMNEESKENAVKPFKEFLSFIKRESFNEYDFENWVRERITTGMYWDGTLNDEQCQRKISEAFDCLSNWRLICYLGEYLTRENNHE